MPTFQGRCHQGHDGLHVRDPRGDPPDRTGTGRRPPPGRLPAVLERPAQQLPVVPLAWWVLTVGRHDAPEPALTPPRRRRRNAPAATPPAGAGARAGNSHPKSTRAAAASPTAAAAAPHPPHAPAADRGTAPLPADAAAFP